MLGLFIFWKALYFFSTIIQQKLFFIYKIMLGNIFINIHDKELTLQGERRYLIEYGWVQLSQSTIFKYG